MCVCVQAAFTTLLVMFRSAYLQVEAMADQDIGQPQFVGQPQFSPEPPAFDPAGGKLMDVHLSAQDGNVV